MKTKIAKQYAKAKSSVDKGIKNKPSLKREKGIVIKKESLMLGLKSSLASGKIKDKKRRVQDSIVSDSPQQIKAEFDADPPVKTLALDEKPDLSMIRKKKMKKDKKSSSKSVSPDKKIIKKQGGMKTSKISESPTSSMETMEKSTSSSSLNKKLLDGVCSGILALMHSKQKAEEKVDLFGSQPQPIVLQVTVHKIPRTPYRFVRCLVPKSVTSVDPDICLIVPDLQRGRKRDVTFAKYVDQYEEKLQENGAKGIKQIIPFTQLRCEYSQFEMKRRLAHTYDLFLCDGRIHGHCYHFLGKVFEKAKKVPVPIEAMKKVDGKLTFSPDLQNEIDKAIRKVSLTLHAHGTSFCIPVGHSQFTKSELAGNIDAVWQMLEKELPGGVQNVRAAYLKGPRTCAVPLYASLVPPKNVPVVQLKDTREPVEDEISTRPGRKVIVYPSGSIKVINEGTPEDREFSKLNPPLELKKGSKKRKNKKDRKPVIKSKRVKSEVNVEDDIRNDNSDDEFKDVNSDDEFKDEFKDVEDAEAAYLSQWSESASLKELGEDTTDESKSKKKKKKVKVKASPKVESALSGKKGISHKYSKGKPQHGKAFKQESKVNARIVKSKSKSKKTT